MPWTPIIRRLEEARLHRGDIVHHLLAGLREQIFLGKLPSGSRLPGEKKLADMLHLSRPTLREALRILAHEGLVVSRWGDGTFITDQLPRIVDGRLSARTAVSPSSWIEPDWNGHDESPMMTAAPDSVAEALGIAPGSTVLMLRRHYAAAERFMARVDVFHRVGSPAAVTSGTPPAARSAVRIGTVSENGEALFQIVETVFDPAGGVSHVVVVSRTTSVPLRLATR
ncbi:GntR family transcriptional regulator [Skermanella stibiiresistens]|uniref:GntR family transcriptional regulator n=1 Tax=Skermanella stibiiresistens TaxID=913326 RepID=UPI0004ADBB93|nr:GntR family transcriptional regulator [Skermanella stibiiresistens]